MLRFLEAPKQGTPTGIVELNSKMLLMKNRGLLSKLTYMGKIKAKSLPVNMCRRALINGKLVCNGKDLQTKCKEWSKKLRSQNVTKGCLEKNAMVKKRKGHKSISIG